MDNPLAEEKTISRNQYRKVLMKFFLTEGLLEFKVCSRRPVTVVIAKFQDGEGNVFENFGYSKVCHPDEFSKTEGLRRALLRAASWAAKDYVNKLMASKDIEIIDRYGKRGLIFTDCQEWKLGSGKYPYNLRIEQ